VSRTGDDADALRRLWRGFRRPVRKDKAFWVAIALCVLAVAAETAMTESIADVNPIALAVVAILVVVVVFSVVGAIVGMFRGFGEGFRQPPTAPTEPAAKPARDDTAARSTSAADLATSAKNLAANVRKPTTADVEKGARTLGRAIGAAKRAARSHPDD
jgi:hypothetical protein